jgi:hypothetical protein
VEPPCGLGISLPCGRYGVCRLEPKNLNEKD